MSKERMVIRNTIPIILTRDEENHMYIPQYPNGYNSLILPSEVDKIIDGLFMYLGTYSDEEILQYNKEKEEHIFITSHTDKKKANKYREGYVYVLECGGRYKVGFAKDVIKRMKQLDTRPFALQLVKSYYSDNAYDIEQEVHKRLEAYKVANEWYYNISFNAIDETILEVERYICDTQF